MRIFLLSLLTLVSCDFSNRKAEANQTITNTELPNGTIEKDTVVFDLEQTPSNDLTEAASDSTIQSGFNWEDELLKVETEISLFTIGSFGEIEEMPSAYRNKSWMGLYLSDSLATLKPVALKFEVEEMQDCGDDVLVRLADDGPTPYFLISGLDSITPGVPYASSEIYEPIDFSHLKHPTIAYVFDWGETQKVNEYISEHRRVQWTVSRQTPTDTITQTLFEANNVPMDNHLNIDFMGDLDGDGIYDLIVDIATGYSYSMNVLFLSTYAEPGEILRPAAVFRTWGC